MRYGYSEYRWQLCDSNARGYLSMSESTAYMVLTVHLYWRLRSLRYQIEHALVRTIVCPVLQPKADAN